MSNSLEKLKKEYRWDIYQCSLKCFNCMYINPHYLISQDFYINCPAGKFFGFDTFYSGGRMEIARGILDGSIKLPLKDNKMLLKVIYACTTCGSCENICYYNREIRTTEVFETLRELLVENEIGPMPEHIKFLKSISENFNPYNEDKSARINWLDEDEKLNEIKNNILENDYKILYFVGCTSSYRTKDIAKATVKILNKLNIHFKILGMDEWCCGSPAARVGDTILARKMAQHNIKVIENCGANLVLFSCAGCYRTFKKDYPKWGLNYNFKVLHISEFISELIKNNKIKLGSIDKKITYHDPCHLGRHLGIYDPPRIVINAIPKINFKEMARNRFNAWCCGAGGGVKSAFKDLAIFAASERLIEAEKTTDAEYLISTCPFCNLNLKDGKKNIETKIIVKDLMELLLECRVELIE